MKHASLAMLMVMASSLAQAKTERCMMRVIKPTRAIESPESVMKAGSLFGPITQMRVQKQSGRISYCAHGDYCYPSTNLEFISPCRIGADSSYQDKDERMYDPQ